MWGQSTAYNRPFLGADLHSAAPGVAARVKEGPRRSRRGCRYTGEHPAILGKERRDFIDYTPVISPPQQAHAKPEASVNRADGVPHGALSG